MTLFQSPNVTIYYDQKQNVLITTWHKNTINDEYKLVLEQILAHTITKKCYFWILVQLEKKGMTLPDDTKWVKEVFVPKVIKNMGVGMRVGVVMSKNIFAEMSLLNVIKDNAELIKNHVFDMQYFKTYEQALAYVEGEQQLKLKS